MLFFQLAGGDEPVSGLFEYWKEVPNGDAGVGEHPKLLLRESARLVDMGTGIDIVRVLFCQSYKLGIGQLSVSSIALTSKTRRMKFRNKTVGIEQQ